MAGPAPMMPERIGADDARTLVLADGRDLAYQEYGDPGGFPVFYFHGTPSCRLEGVFADGAASRQGFRLVAVDRPGYGRSTFAPGRRFADWPADVCALADALGWAEFGVAGHSGAGPHLFACGVFISPKRLKFIGALGPWGPLATPEIIGDLNLADSGYALVARHAPWTFGAAFAPVGWCAKYVPRLLGWFVAESLPETDRQHLRDSGFRRHFNAIQAEAFRQGGRGGAYESLLDYRPWDFEVARIAVPTHIWQGERDGLIPRAMSEYLERTIPGVDMHWVAGKGHLNVEDWDAILAACAADVGH
ncbi:alpha/beta fold hydrolase [Mycobacterium sp.]|uniref:alpha/beta fold hydrolase n=1 Tax=Mycobacterium sp. TaxID=1785 RepID=UPI003A8BCF98